MVQLTDGLVAALDAEAARRGRSRSAVIRTAVKGYRRVPPATPDEWGSIEDFTERAATEVFQRVAAEEAARGDEPW